MPELPEVNTFKKYFDGTSLNQKILEVSVADDKIIRNMGGPEFADRLANRTFLSSYRRGKYLFAHLDDGNHVLFHFGMTGDFKYYSAEEDRPKHERFHFLFEGGSKLGFDCPRKFARIVHFENLNDYIQSIGLGPDALEIKEAEFLQKMEGRTSTIKGFLLNQKLVAGVGNLYADEICYQTRVHPGSRVNALSKKKRKVIYRTMRSVLSVAVERTAHYKDYPDDWFWNWRVKDGESNKGEIKVEKIAGRTTYWVKGWQRLYG
ncbi:MAG: DNA-formamidopyrimidine glycosylase family protein [Bacteroidota bacterium]